MKLLAIETSGAACSATVAADGKFHTAFLEKAGTHSAALFPEIEKAFTISGLNVKDMDAFAVSAGPGSFTGIRIGVAAVKGLAWGQDKPTIGISSLEAAVWNSDAEGEICALIDARHESYYFAVFEGKDGVYIRKTADAVLPASEIAEKLQDGCTLVGEGAKSFASLFPERSFCVSDAVQSSFGVARAAMNAGEEKFVPARDLEAVYLRLSQAERTLKQKNE